MNNYFNPESAAVVYWSLFSLLLAWLIGLFILKTPRKSNISFTPKIFKRLDQVILKGGLPFLFTWGLLFIFNYTDPSAGLRGIQTGEGSRMFLWGLASFSTINFVCLYSFLKRHHVGVKPVRYYLLILPSISALSSTLSGSRGALFLVGLMVLVYWLGLNIHKTWTIQNLLKIFSLVLILLPLVFILGLFAQVLRPLFKYTESVDSLIILETLNFESVLLVKENLLFGTTELLHRIAAIKAQFYILNDWWIHNPWQYYNPITRLMRAINDFVPGDMFPGILTINQLFNYVYHDAIVHYASEMWSIQGTLYLYFGHILAPIVVFLIAIITNRLYPSLERKLKASPSFAAFFIFLLFDIFTNGTMERIIPVDIIRPLASFVIFVVIYKAFSLFLPTRVRLSKKGIVQHSPANARI